MEFAVMDCSQPGTKCMVSQYASVKDPQCQRLKDGNLAMQAMFAFSNTR